MNKMRRTMNLSIGYFIAAMISGVFYREFTKWNEYTQPTVLGVLHTHLLILGVGVFLLLAVLNKQIKIERNKQYNSFFLLYNLSLPLMILTMLLRGITEVKAISLSKMFNGMLSGVAGLSHIGLAIALCLLLFIIKKELLREEGKQ